jgi:hypothetical protein
MSDQEAARDPKGQAKSKMGGQATTSLTIGGTFTTGLDASLNMSGIDDDLGSESQVDIYAANTVTPSGRANGAPLRRGNYAPAPANFPTNLDGGPWTSSGNYWVQVTAPNDVTWQGHITASRGTHDIVLTKQTF